MTATVGEDQAWSELEERLAGSVERLPDLSYLVLERRIPDDEDGVHFVQFARTRGGLLAEAVSNLYLEEARRLDPAQVESLAGLGWDVPLPRSKHYRNWRRRWLTPVPFAEVAALGIRSLREVYGVERPGDLWYRRFARGGAGLPDDALGIEPAPPTAWAPSRIDATIEAALRWLNAATDLDRPEPGTWTVRLRDTRMRVRRIDTTPPLVRVYASFLAAVEPTVALYEALNRANTDLLYGRVLWVNHDLIASVEVPAITLTEDLVHLACQEVAAMSARLAGQFGANLRMAPRRGGAVQLAN